ncbi:efflux RND transporter periplasmic adaptor subunit [bacterium]|nr:efflux RND transporter periplasmic adaptor subunit [bacterium]
MRFHSHAPRALGLVLLALGAAALSTGCDSNGDANPAGSLETPTLDLAPLVTGRVLRVGAEEGQHVDAGDTLLVVDTDLLRLKRGEAEAALRGQQAQRAAAEADLDQANRQLSLAESTLERVRALAAEGSATQQQVDDLSTQRDLARSRVEAAGAHVSALEAEGERIQASLDVLHRQMDDGVVLAPIDGTLLVRAAEPGEVASAGRTALRLADLSSLELRIYLETADLDRVALGETLPVRVDALDGAPLEGRVTWISDEAEFTPKNAQTRDARAQLVYAVKLVVPNPDGRLHLGMTAEVELP